MQWVGQWNIKIHWRTSLVNKVNPFLINPNDEKRNQNDYYPTPPIATEALIHYFKDIIPKRIWEPCSGRGWISNILKQHNYDVISTELFEYSNPLIDDIQFGKDYFKTNIPNDCDGIITNPPYANNFAELLIERSLKEVKFLAILQRLFFLESSKRYLLLSQTRPDVLIFSSRINFDEKNFDNPNFKKQIGGMLAFSWFVWHENCDGNIQWVDPTYNFINQNTLEDFFG